MVKTSVYLSEAERSRLARLSRETGKSQTEIIREAIAQYVPAGTGERYFAVDGAGYGDGRSVADIPEEELLTGFGER